MRDNHHLIRGYTLIELLAVIAIIGVLVTILSVTLGKAREAAQTTTCASNMRQIGVALLLYTNENQNKIPPRWVSGGMPWNDRLNEYFGIKKYPSGRYFENPVWLCPAAKIIDDSMFNRHYGMNAYVLNDRWALQRNAIPAPANIILIGEMNDNSDFVLPELNFTQEGDVKTRYRMSHKGGTGANYAFADGHVEFIIGRITDLNAATSPWKWW